MTDSPQPTKSWGDRARSFLSVGFPVIVMLCAIAVAPREIGEPAFVKDWSVEARALGLFAAIMAGMTGSILLWELWSRWIEPKVFANREPRSLLDTIEGQISVAAVLPLVSYGKQLTSAGWSFSALFLVYLALTGPLLIWRIWRGWRAYLALRSEASAGAGRQP